MAPRARRPSRGRLNERCAAHVAHVVGDQAERPHQPDREDHHQQGDGDDRGRAEQQGLPARRLDELAEALHGLADADGADDRALAVARLLADRHRHVHDRGARIALDVGAGARAVAAAQGEKDVVPARVVGAELDAARIEDDRAPAVDDGDAQLDTRLLDAVDVGAEAARVEAAKDRLERIGVQAAVGRCGLDQGGDEIGRLDQRFLGRFAVARIDVAELAIHQERHAERVGDENADEDAVAAGQRVGAAGRSSASA